MSKKNNVPPRLNAGREQITMNIMLKDYPNLSISERPVLFSGTMVQAILAGRKTQTRRIIKGAEKFPDIINFSPWVYEGERQWASVEKDGTHREWGCPYGMEGDRLWVRETWRPALSETHECYAYKADLSYQCGKPIPEGSESFAWKPSIHMPRKACRLVLEVKNIRVERLQEISEEDAIAEGIEIFKNWKTPNSFIRKYRNYLDGSLLHSPIDSFKSLWISINGLESWNQNPWVWVVEFERVGGAV